MKVERNQSVSPRAFKTTSGNAEKRLRTRQETQLTIDSKKTMGVAIRQKITQKHLVEKKRVKAWKQVIMQEVAQELQAIRKS